MSRPLLQLQGDFAFAQITAPARLAYRSHWIHVARVSGGEWAVQEVRWRETKLVGRPAALAWTSDGRRIVAPNTCAEELLSCDPGHDMADRVVGAGWRGAFGPRVAGAAGRMFALHEPSVRNPGRWSRRIVEVDLQRRRFDELHGPWAARRVWDFTAIGERLWICEGLPDRSTQLWCYELKRASVRPVAILRSGAHVTASVTGELVACGWGHHVRLAGDGSILEQIAGDAMASVSPDGRMTAALSDAGTLVLREHPDPARSTVRLVVRVPGEVSEVPEVWQTPAWSQDSRLLAVTLQRRRDVVGCLVDVERGHVCTAPRAFWRYPAWEPLGGVDRGGA